MAKRLGLYLRSSHRQQPLSKAASLVSPQLRSQGLDLLPQTSRKGHWYKRSHLQVLQQQHSQQPQLKLSLRSHLVHSAVSRLASFLVVVIKRRSPLHKPLQPKHLWLKIIRTWRRRTPTPTSASKKFKTISRQALRTQRTNGWHLTSWLRSCRARASWLPSKTQPPWRYWPRWALSHRRPCRSMETIHSLRIS